MSFETKYVAPSGTAPQLLHRLRRAFAADGEHPVNRIHSVYFDTPRGDAFAEVDNGDFHKSKVRVRWYAPLDAVGQEAVGEDVVEKAGENGREAAGRPSRGAVAFVEHKRKFGARRRKLRVAVRDLRTDLPLHHAAWLAVPPLLRSEGADLPTGLLQPTLHVSYRRHRFVEPTTGLRLALDDDIRAERVHARLSRLLPLARRPAPWLVFEAKGDTRQLPASLAFVRALGARRRSFSKYGLWNELL